MSRLKERYQKEVAPALKKEFGYGNVMAIPRIEKVVVNMGLGEATSNAKLTATMGAERSELARERLGNASSVIGVGEGLGVGTGVGDALC